MTTRCVASAAVIAWAAAGMACQQTSSAARPDQPTAAEALGESDVHCEDGQIPDEGTPLIVNWRDEDRASLEAAMNRGVAVVRYSCEGIEVLRACHAPGTYDYSGVSRKINAVSMRDGAEVQANFGAGLGALRGLQAALASGRTLNLAYVLVGMNSTTVARVSEDELEGRCDGATHFVYDVSRGAFALETSAGTEGRAAAEILGRGAGAGGHAHKETQSQDGDPAACDASTTSDAEPIEGCRAPLRVSLFAIDPRGAAAPPDEVDAAGRRDARSCPPGFVYADDQCVREGEAHAHLCRPGDVDECRRQCETGSTASCGRLSVALARVISIPASGREAIRSALANLEEVEPQLRAACDDGEGAACSAVAFVRFRDLTGEQRERNQREGMNFAEKGCLAGDAHGCRLVRRAYTTESGRIVGVDLSPQRFASILERGCARGAPLPCQYLAELYAMGYAVSRDVATASPLAERACRGGLARACVLAAGLSMRRPRCAETLRHYASSMPADATSERRAQLPSACGAVSPDPGAAGELLSRACHLGDEPACGLAASAPTEAY